MALDDASGARTGVRHGAADDGHELLELLITHGVGDVQRCRGVLSRLHAAHHSRTT